MALSPPCDPFSWNQWFQADQTTALPLLLAIPLCLFQAASARFHSGNHWPRHCAAPLSCATRRIVALTCRWQPVYSFTGVDQKLKRLTDPAGRPAEMDTLTPSDGCKSTHYATRGSSARRTGSHHWRDVCQRGEHNQRASDDRNGLLAPPRLHRLARLAQSRNGAQAVEKRKFSATSRLWPEREDAATCGHHPRVQARGIDYCGSVSTRLTSSGV